MPYSVEQPEFRVAVDGAFDDQGFWCIYGRVSCFHSLTSEARSRLAAEVKLELLRGISREARRGRSCGAERFRLLIQDDGDLVGSVEIPSTSGAPLEVSRAGGPSRPTTGTASAA